MKSPDKRPHIVIFNPDQWRGDVLGHAGNRAAVTPYLDKIVQEDAVSFTRAFCQNPVCTPSRCSFMSGWYPHVRGHRSMFHMMQPDEPMLLRNLKQAGYHVWWGGKNDLLSPKANLEEYCDVKYKPHATKPMFGNNSEWRGKPGSDTYYSFFVGKLETDEAPLYHDQDWAYVEGAIDQIKNRPADQPLCMYLPLIYPHPPYAVEEPWFGAIQRTKLPPRIQPPEDWSTKPSITSGLYDLLQMSKWSESRWRELRATYYGMCARVDYQFGMLVEALKQEGIYEDTAIFFFSDHGDFTGDYSLVEKTQNTFEDCLVRVPFIVKPPAEVDIVPGTRTSLVELVDFVATVQDMAKLPMDYSHFGKSLLPLIRDPEIEHRDAVFAEGGRLEGESHCMEQSAHSADPSFLYYPRSSLQSSMGPEHTKATMIRTSTHKYVRRLYEKDELYDLVRDPEERLNEIDNPHYAEILVELKERLLTFYQTTCDVVPFERNAR